MSLILIATDFSQISDNAAHYACRLALEQRARVMIIHSFMVPVMFSDVPMPASLVNEAQNDAEIQMSKHVKELAEAYPGLEIKGKVFYGDTIDVIDEYAEENSEPWMVVVGNSMAAEQSVWPDSTLMEAFKKLKFPVLAVPSEARFRPVHNICFAFDNKPGSDAILAQLRDITTQLKATLQVLIVKTATNGQVDNAVDVAAKNLLAPLNPGYHIVSTDQNVDDSIEHFAGENNIDWPVMIPRRHSFFEGLFQKSHTKGVAHHIHIPILVLHENA